MTAFLPFPTYRPPAMDTCRRIEIIETTIARYGAGTEEDPVRIIRQYWTLDGDLIANVDDWAIQQEHP